MLIISLGQHQIILDKFWMNNHEVVLDMQFDRLWFKSGACDHYGFSFTEFVFPFQLDMRRFFMHQLPDSS